MTKLPGLALSTISAALAGIMFKQLWRLLAREQDAPQATDPERTWRQVLLAAALQGAVFAVVKASVERSAVQSGRKLAQSQPQGSPNGP